MQTNFPTVTIYFGFAYTYCSLEVYKKDEEWIRKILKAHASFDKFLRGDESEEWQEIDTRVIISLIRESLPDVLVQSVSKSITEAISQEL